jgi:Type IV secretion system pilin
MPAKKCTKSMRGRPPRPAATGHTCRAGAALRLVVAFTAATTATVVFLLGDSAAAHAAVPGPVLAADSVEAVVNNIRTWLFALLGAVATLFLTVGGLRLMWANGDPGEAEKGKAALKSAAIGYALALLSPLIVTVVAGWVK